MKVLLATITTALSCWGVHADLGSMPRLKMPTQSQWALAMIKDACGVHFRVSDFGRKQFNSDGVIYTAYNSAGIVLAQAWASSQYVWARKACLETD